MKNKSLFLTLLIFASVGSNLFALNQKQQKVLNIATGVAAGAGAAWSAFLMVVNATKCYQNYTNWRDFLCNKRDCWLNFDMATANAYAMYHLTKASVDSFKAKSEDTKQEDPKPNRSVNLAKAAGHTYFTGVSLVTGYGLIKGAIKQKDKVDLDYLIYTILGAPLAYGLYKSSTEAYKNFKLALKSNNK